MPKQNKKKGKKEKEEDFDDMLAEFQAGDLATASNSANSSTTSSSSSGAEVDARASVTLLPSPAAGHNVSEEAIIGACLAGNLAQLRRWRQDGVRVKTAGPLCQGVVDEVSFDVLSFLVKELGADVNQRDKQGFPALATAAYAGRHHFSRYLVEELGADLNIPSTSGQTPLSFAAARGHLPVVRILLQLKADIDRRNNDGATPLMIASFGKHDKIVKWLVKAGADTSASLHRVIGSTAAFASETAGTSAEQTAYLEAKTHCSNVGCTGAGIMKCTGCKQARYCEEACQLAHWKAHKVDCRRWSAELAAEKGHSSK
jgi:hypothetical protein